MIKIVVNDYLIGYVSEQKAETFLHVQAVLHDFFSDIKTQENLDDSKFRYAHEEHEIRTFICLETLDIPIIKSLIFHLKNRLGDEVIWLRHL